LLRISANSGAAILRLNLAARAPIHALQLIGESDARRIAGDRHFERIVFDPGRRGTTDHEPGLAIVARGAEHDGRTMSGLFVAGLRV
jgi:hypothetical protein